LWPRKKPPVCHVTDIYRQGFARRLSLQRGCGTIFRSLRDILSVKMDIGLGNQPLLTLLLFGVTGIISALAIRRYRDHVVGCMQ